jgi:hypothetical protein
VMESIVFVWPAPDHSHTKRATNCTGFWADRSDCTSTTARD